MFDKPHQTRTYVHDKAGQCGDICCSRIENERSESENAEHTPQGMATEYTLNGIPRYLSDAGETYMPGGNVDMQSHIAPDELSTKVDKIKARISHMRCYSGLQKYPYDEGIEGLKTSLICTLNILSDVVSLLKEKG